MYFVTIARFPTLTYHFRQSGDIILQDGLAISSVGGFSGNGEQSLAGKVN